MKTCIKCNMEKDLDQFYTRRGVHTHSYCKSCVNQQTKDRQRNIKLEAVKYKGGQCVHCGIQGHPAIFDFHHLDPSQKEFSLGKFKQTKMNDKIKEELDKCILLCANCHRVEHAKY